MIGSVIVLTALVFSIAAMVLYYFTFKGNVTLLNYARISYHLMAMLVIAASAFLWYIILTHQYQYHYVFSYSMNSLSTGFLISSFWGGQEGSFLLWLLLTSIVGIFLQSYTSKRNDLEPRVMMVFTLSTTFLLVMVSPFFKNPFAYIWSEPIFLSVKEISRSYLNLPVLQSFMFSDTQTNQSLIKMSPELMSALGSVGVSVNDFIINGKGLNPQLLNFWMQIHPPILFSGFAMSTVPFAFAIAALIKNEYRDWIKQAFPWVLAGAGVLGLGIMMGGYWAYEMLGWGGYWAWDPVENSSLIPWLVGVASVHTLLVQKKSQGTAGIGKFAKTNIILCLLTYILVIYSTFLTRSGVLGDASVHSFVDPGKLVYTFLVLFILTFTLLGFGLLLYRWKALTKIAFSDEGVLSRELALFTGAVALCASAFIILLGTSAPLFKISVDTSFYNEMNLPIAIIIGLVNGLSLLLKWKNTKKEDLLKSLLLHAGISLFVTVLIGVFGSVTNIMLLLLVYSSIFTITVNGEVAVKIIRGNYKMLGAYISHIGIAIVLIGIVGSAGFTGEKDLQLKPNKPQEAFGYKFTFVNIEPFENNTKYKFIIDLEKEGSTTRVTPVMYISDFNNSLMREPAILNLASKDIYISPLGYDEPDPHAGAHHKLTKGNPVDVDGVKITFVKFDFSKEQMQAMSEGKKTEIVAEMTAEANGKLKNFTLNAKIEGENQSFSTYELTDPQMNIKLAKLSADGNIEIDIVKPNGPMQVQPDPVLSISASVKPFISFVWIGVVVLFAGFVVSTLRRLKESVI